MRTRTLIGGVVAATLALPASAQAASLSLPGPVLGDMSAAATTVSASERPTVRLSRAGSADLVIAAIDRDGSRFTVVVAAFNRSPGAGSGSTRITISGRGVKLSRTLTAGNVLFGQPSRCTDSEAIAYEQTDTGRFLELKGKVPALPPKVGKPARLVKYAVDEMCGASYQQHGFLTHFAWNVGADHSAAGDRELRHRGVGARCDVREHLRERRHEPAAAGRLGAGHGGAGARSLVLRYGNDRRRRDRQGPDRSRAPRHLRPADRGGRDAGRRRLPADASGARRGAAGSAV